MDNEPGQISRSANLERLVVRAEELLDNQIELLLMLTDMRLRKELTQTEIGERMGVSQPSVAAFERYGANPTLSTLRRYAHAVGAIVNFQVLDDDAIQAEIDLATSLEKTILETWHLETQEDFSTSDSILIKIDKIDNIDV